MRSTHKIAAGVLGILLSFASPAGLASLLSEDSAVKSEYMEAQRDSEVYSLIGEHVIPVGEVKQGQLIQVFPADAEYYEFKFGHGTGFIDKDDVRDLKKSHKVKDDLGELNKPLTNQNLITQKAINVYTDADNTSDVFGVLEENLRYPIIGKLKDRLNNTWYEINIGDRLGYVSELDCEIDTGIPVLTYHHLLKNEENKRFRHTSTTTSDVAFSNQMTYLKQAGYDTISLYQLEAYLNNQINLPGKAVVLTFDDGLKSVYRYAYPVLKNYGFRATAFIISSRIKRHPQKWNPDSLQFMSISELKQIQDVFDVQSHTHFLHRTDGNRQPILLSRSLHNIEFDFEHSRRALSQFNPHVLYVSYPFGGYNQRAIQAAKDAGFHMAVTTVQGKVKPGDNPYTLKRLYILRTDSIQTMADRIANKPGTLVVQ
ncbi:polysaccharide deacetylase family protein [Serratia sp. BNK-12]|uniref:polysaccharide deacetylase family protein n=1 Tax=Serratia sp. BNK-12 TaxID=3376149 RepID=UPI0039BFF2B6